MVKVSCPVSIHWDLSKECNELCRDHLCFFIIIWQSKVYGYIDAHYIATTQNVFCGCLFYNLCLVVLFATTFFVSCPVLTQASSLCRLLSLLSEMKAVVCGWKSLSLLVQDIVTRQATETIMQEGGLQLLQVVQELDQEVQEGLDLLYTLQEQKASVRILCAVQYLGSIAFHMLSIVYFCSF